MRIKFFNKIMGKELLILNANYMFHLMRLDTTRYIIRYMPIAYASNTYNWLTGFLVTDWVS